MSRSTDTHREERALWSLFAPHIIQPKKGRRPPSVALQLRKGVAEEIVKSGGLLLLSSIADAMWDSELSKEREKKWLAGKEGVTNE
jgi:hypothetical protein